MSSGAGVPVHFNAALTSGTAVALIATQIFASPLRFDENWNPQPYLAHDWSVSQDGLTVMLYLVEGATFHDGAPITAEDVAFSLFTVKNHHPFRSMLDPIDQVETPDDHTVVIHLRHPHPAFLLAMSPALMPVLPKHIYGDGHSLRDHPANLAPIGSGPFKFVEYIPNELLVLERYENYFLPGRPYLDGLIIKLSDSEPEQLIDMKRQEVHLAGPVLRNEQVQALSSVEHLITTQRGYEGIGPIDWLAFNLLRQPLDDKRVRQAIAYAIDPGFITGFIQQGNAQIATGPITPGSPFYEPDVPHYDLDLDQANLLLDQANYPVGQDGYRFDLSLDYLPVAASPQVEIARYLKRQLSEIGIRVEVRRSPSFGAWAKRIAEWDFDMTLDTVYNWADPLIGVHRTYLSSNIRQGILWSNTQNYRNPQVDDLLSQAGRELDPLKRKDLYSQFQKVVVDDLPVIWFDVVPFRTVYHIGLGNPPVTIWGIHAPLDELYWRTPPVNGFLTPRELSASPATSLKALGTEALALIQEHGLRQATELLLDPSEGFLDLQGDGTHVIGFTLDGLIFLDNSGRLDPGMDIRGLLNPDGLRLLTLLADLSGETADLEPRAVGEWPHPGTHQIAPMQAWCAFLTSDDLVCALSWPSTEE